MNIDFENKVIDLLSENLKNKVKETNFKFSEADLLIIINTCSHGFEKRNKLFEEFAENVDGELKDYSLKCMNAYKSYYEDFKTLKEGEFYKVNINWPDSFGNYNLVENSDEVHSETYYASTFDEAVRLMDNFYRSAHLAGTNRRLKANYNIERLLKEGKNNCPEMEKWSYKKGPHSNVFFDENKVLADVNVVDRNFEFPICKYNGKDFSPYEYMVKFPNYVKDGDLLIAQNPEFTKYFVAYDNKEEFSDRIYVVDVETGKKIAFHPDFLKIINKEDLPKNLLGNFNKIIEKIKG